MFNFLNEVMIELKWRRLLVVLANARQLPFTHSDVAEISCTSAFACELGGSENLSSALIYH